MKYRFEIDKRLLGLNEYWKDVNNYEGLYQVSNLGRIRSLDRVVKQKNRFNNYQNVLYKGRVLKPQKQKNGYYIIGLHKNNKTERKLLHRLVAETFTENPNNYKYINHKDSNIYNNSVNNLEWCTQSYNIKYAYETGRKIPPHQRKVVQKTLNDTVLCEYKSIMEAFRKTGIQATNISKCCRKLREMAGGYKWQYTE